MLLLAPGSDRSAGLGHRLCPAPHTLAVERYYKGGSESRLTIYQQRTLGAPVLRVGERWLLFLHVDRFGHLTAGPCAPSAKLEPGQDPSGYVAGWLGDGWAPDAPPAGPWNLAAGIVFFVLAAGGLVAFLRRRRRPQIQ